MISRLSTFAATFAIIATAALAFGAHAQQQPVATAAATAVVTKQVRVIELPRVVVTARRVEQSVR